MASDGDHWANGGPLRRPYRAHPRSDARPRHRCTVCHGRGVLPGISKVQGRGEGMGSDYGPCPECGGSGWLSEDSDRPDEDPAD